MVLFKVDKDIEKIELFSFKIASNYPIEIDKKMSSIYGACACSSAIGAVAKEYTAECGPNPEFLEHCKRFLLVGVSNGFFTELQNTTPCSGCSFQSFFLRKKKEKEKEKVLTDEVSSLGSSDEDHCGGGQAFCAKCYVERFCNVHTFQNHDGSETYYIFKEKGSGSILYQSSPIIERSSGAVSISGSS